MPKTKDGGYSLHEPEAASGRYSPRNLKVQIDEEAEAWINEMYAREAEKKQKETRKE